MAYGYEVQGRHDRKVNVAKKMAELVSETTIPGLLLVNDLPWRGWSLLYWTHLAYNNPH